MAAVDPLFAQWLQANADFVVSTDATAAARWGSSAATTERITGIATRAAATDEAGRQLAFFSRGPFVVDQHRLRGVDWIAAIGRVVTLSIAQLGYDAGIDVYVLEVVVDRQAGLSVVDVLRPLRTAA